MFHQISKFKEFELAYFKSIQRGTDSYIFGHKALQIVAQSVMVARA